MTHDDDTLDGEPTRPLHGGTPSGLLALLIHGEHKTLAYPLPDSGEVLIGRGSDCDLVLHDSAVSRRHAVLRTGGGLSLEDLGSANGTRINGEPLVPGKPAALQLDQPIKVGEKLLVVQHITQPQPRAPLVVAAHRSAPSPAGATLQRMLSDLQRIAATPMSVLVEGETGVGKELVADLLHQLSPRAKGPFIKINCGAFSESLIEDELFGHERGAFTGATQAKAGLLESAHGGSVMLDELGELSLELQKKLLRVVETRRVRRLGSVTERSIDVRFIAATNRDLRREVREGRFRQDLFYRLGETVRIPPAPGALGRDRRARERLPERGGRPLRPAVRPCPLPRGARLPEGLLLARERPGAQERHGARSFL